MSTPKLASTCVDQHWSPSASMQPPMRFGFQSLRREMIWKLWRLRWGARSLRQRRTKSGYREVTQSGGVYHNLCKNIAVESQYSGLCTLDRDFECQCWCSSGASTDRWHAATIQLLGSRHISWPPPDKLQGSFEWGGNPKSPLFGFPSFLARTPRNISASYWERVGGEISVHF